MWKMASTKYILQWTEKVVIRGCQIRIMRRMRENSLSFIVRIWHPLITTSSVHCEIHRNIRHFPDNSELKKNVREALKSQSKDFYRTDMRWYFRRKKCVEKDWDYVGNNGIHNKDILCKNYNSRNKICLEKIRRHYFRIDPHTCSIDHSNAMDVIFIRSSLIK